MHRRKIVIYSQQRLTSELVAAIIGYTNEDIILCHDIRFLEQTCRKSNAELVIILSPAPLLGGQNIIKQLRGSGRKTEIYVISWRHAEQAVLSLLEYGIDQYMTFPICMGRLKAKISAHNQHNRES